MVLNFAVWYNTPESYQLALHEFAGFYNAHRARLPYMIWRDSSPQHFDTTDGSFAGAQTPYKCQALPGVTLDNANCLHSTNAETQVRPWSRLACCHH